MSRFGVTLFWRCVRGVGLCYKALVTCNRMGIDLVFGLSRLMEGHREERLNPKESVDVSCSSLVDCTDTSCNIIKIESKIILYVVSVS